MAKKNYKDYLQYDMSCKKYLYVLRGIACAEYIRKEKKLPPLPYKEVIKYLPDYVQKFFEKCIVKKNETEKAGIIAEENVSRFISSSFVDEQSPEKVFKNEKGLNDYLINVIKKYG